MKKAISLILAAALLICALAACSTPTENNNPNGPDDDNIPAGSEAVTITYHYNAEGMDDVSVRKVKDSRLATDTPEREGWQLLDWYTDEACTQRFASGTKVSEDLDLYARWGQVYVLEAEYVDLSSFHGQGFSGGCDGAQAISQDKGGLQASNGVYLTYMYNQGLTVAFDFTSNQAVSDAQVILRLSAEMMDISFTSSEFTVAVNGKALSYSDISLTENQEFTDFVVGTGVALNEGGNTITLTTSNSRAMAGTMYATAPIIDCVKIVSSSAIQMTEHTENMDKFSMD